MLNNTTWTAQTLKDNISSHFSDTNVTDDNIKLGLNFFLSLVGRAKRKALRSGGLKSVTVSIPSTGYDLSTLTDIGSLTSGFEVWENNVQIFPTSKDDLTERGYYLVGNSLFLNNARAASIKINYQEKTPRITNEALSDFGLPIDQDLEQTVFRYIAGFFFEGQFRFDMAQMNEALFLNELLEFFSEPTKTRIIR